MEMFHVEAQAYNNKRAALLDELRAVGADH